MSKDDRGHRNNFKCFYVCGECNNTKILYTQPLFKEFNIGNYNKILEILKYYNNTILT